MPLYCPFFPNELNPCTIHNCQFQCTGGCAISLSAHAYDALRNTDDIKREVKAVKDKLNYYIEPDIQQIKRALNK